MSTYDLYQNGKKVGMMTMDLDNPIPPEPPEPPEPPIEGDVTITGMAGGREIDMTSYANLAGGFGFVGWGGKIFIPEPADFGQGLQSSISFDHEGEKNNPTEHGGSVNYPGTSMSELLYRNTAPFSLASGTQMAYWIPVDGKALSSVILRKDVTIGHEATDHAIEYKVIFVVPEPHAYAQFEALCGYMPSTFARAFGYDKKTHDLTDPDDKLPIILCTDDLSLAMGCYSPDPGAIYDHFTAAQLEQYLVKWNVVFRRENIPAGDYAFRCFVVIGSLEDVRISMIQLHDYFKEEIPVPPDTKGWVRLPEWDQPESPYFSIDGDRIGEYGYQGGVHSSRLFGPGHTLIKEFEAESVISMLDGIVLLENYGPNNTGAIWYDGAIRKEIGSLCLEIFRWGSYYYVTWKDYNNLAVPGGWLRSLDRIIWQDDGIGQGHDMLLGMCSDGKRVCTAGSAEGDWGYPGSYPVFYQGSARMDSLPNRKGDGAWGAFCFKGKLYAGICGNAAIWRIGDGIVLELPGFVSIHAFMELDGMLLALVNRDSGQYDSGAVIMQSPTGDPGTWTRRGEPFDSPMLFQGQGRRVVGGRFSQGSNGFGRVYDLV